MKRALVGFSLVAAAVVCGATIIILSRPAEAQSCTPGAYCTVGSETTCLGFGAVCDTTAMVCVCAADAGVDAGTSDGGGGSSGDGGGGTGGTGGGGFVGGPGVPPPVGGGAETAPRSPSCSFAPGRAY